MIGNGHPVPGTRYVILEEGDLNPETHTLDVKRYLVVKPNGDVEIDFDSLEAAFQYVLENCK